MKKKKKRNLLKVLFVLFLFSTLILSFLKSDAKNFDKSLKSKSNTIYATASNNKNNKYEKEYKLSKKENKDITLLIGGSITSIDDMDNIFINSKETYNDLFYYMKDTIDDSVLFLNLNTILNQKKSHEQFSEALKSLKVDIINTGSKNLLSHSSKGFFETFNVLKNNNLNVLGLKDNLAEKDYKILNKNENKIGIISYNLINNQSKNSMYNHICSLNTENMEESFFKVDEHMENLKTEGVDFIITIVNKNEASNEDLDKIISNLKERGSNLILVYDEEKTIINLSKEDNIPIINNASNFLSLNNIQDSKNYEMNYLIKLVLEKDKNTYKIHNVTYIPLSMYKTNNKLHLIPLKDKKDYKDLNITNLKDIKILDKRREETLEYLKKIENN